MFMVVKIQIVFPEAAHYDHAARRPAVGEAGLAAPATAAAGAGAVRHAAGTEVGEEDRVGGSRRSWEPPGLEVGVSGGHGGDSCGQ